MKTLNKIQIGRIASIARMYSNDAKIAIDSFQKKVNHFNKDYIRVIVFDTTVNGLFEINEQGDFTKYEGAVLDSELEKYLIMTDSIAKNDRKKS